MNVRKHILEDWRAKKQVQTRNGQTLISGKERFSEETENDVSIIGKLHINARKSKTANANAKKYIGEDFKADTEWEKEDDFENDIKKLEQKQKATMLEKKSKEITTKERGEPKFNLNRMSEEILKMKKIINHDNNLYLYTGRSYRIIKNGEELLKLIRSHISQDAFGSISTNRFNDLMTFLKADIRLIPKNYEEKILKSQYYIAFQNGVLDIRTLKLHSHSDEYLVFYELDANWKEKAYPKRFIRFLEDISGDDSSIMKRVVESIGYLLSAVNDGKYFFVMGTAPDSGKSTLGALLEKIIGQLYIAHLSTYQLDNRFALGDIHGKTLNLSMDLPKGKITPIVASIIKQITGGDVITTDQKYERMRDAHSNMRFLFATNYPVVVPKEDDDDSFWNRMIIIPFQYSVEKSDRDYILLQKLLEEKEDIISFCLTAFHAVLHRGYIFSDCRVAEEMKNQWRKQEDDLVYTLKSFLEEFVTVTGNQEDSLYAQDLYNAYQDYCRKHNYGCIVYNKVIDWCESNLSKCKRKRIHRTGSNPRSGFIGMRFINDANILKGEMYS